MWVTQHHQLKTYQIWFLVYDTMLPAFHYCMTSRHCVLAPSTGIISTRVATDILSNVIPECPGFILGGLFTHVKSILNCSCLTTPGSAFRMPCHYFKFGSSVAFKCHRITQDVWLILCLSLTYTRMSDLKGWSVDHQWIGKDVHTRWLHTLTPEDP